MKKTLKKISPIRVSCILIKNNRPESLFHPSYNIMSVFRFETNAWTRSFIASGIRFSCAPNSNSSRLDLPRCAISFKYHELLAKIFFVIKYLIIIWNQQYSSFDLTHIKKNLGSFRFEVAALISPLKLSTIFKFTFPWVLEHFEKNMAHLVPLLPIHDLESLKSLIRNRLGDLGVKNGLKKTLGPKKSSGTNGIPKTPGKSAQNGQRVFKRPLRDLSMVMVPFSKVIVDEDDSEVSFGTASSYDLMVPKFLVTVCEWLRKEDNITIEGIFRWVVCKYLWRTHCNNFFPSGAPVRLHVNVNSGNLLKPRRIGSSLWRVPIPSMLPVYLSNGSANFQSRSSHPQSKSSMWSKLFV